MMRFCKAVTFILSYCLTQKTLQLYELEKGLFGIWGFGI